MLTQSANVVSAYRSPAQWICHEHEKKSRYLVLEAAVVCDSCTAWEFVTFCEERRNLELIRFCTHELPLFLSMALLVVFKVCQGFVAWGLFRLFVRNRWCLCHLCFGGTRKFLVFLAQSEIVYSKSLGFDKCFKNFLQHPML
jgi:hypothetical protein